MDGLYFQTVQGSLEKVTFEQLVESGEIAYMWILGEKTACERH